MEDLGKIFTIDRLSDSTCLFFFDPKCFNVSYDDIIELTVALSIATNDAITIYPERALFLRGILCVIQNPLMSKYYTADLVEDAITEFFTGCQIDGEDDFDDDDDECEDCDGCVGCVGCAGCDNYDECEDDYDDYDEDDRDGCEDDDEDDYEDGKDPE